MSKARASKARNQKPGTKVCFFVLKNYVLQDFKVHFFLSLGILLYTHTHTQYTQQHSLVLLQNCKLCIENATESFLFLSIFSRCCVTMRENNIGLCVCTRVYREELFSLTDRLCGVCTYY